MGEGSGADSGEGLGPGAKIDRYEIVRSVAKGGMGHVWLGRFGGKHGFEKLVAIKTMLPELAAFEQFRTMLLDEARICTRLEHANIAQILDVGEHGEVPYIVFEWVEGASLEQLCHDADVRGEAIALGPLLRVLADACSGLHAAHVLTDETGRPLRVIHRDVTPNNIIVSKKGFAKLIDFGVAKARDRIAGETRSGIVKGTPQYMAPEQARGDKVDRRADVWAIGAVLYRALQGAPPFKDRFALEAFIRKTSEPAPLSPKIPEDVRAIVTQAMARDPADRFESADELRFALERAMTASDSRRSIVDLFPPDTPPAVQGDVSQLPTTPEDMALARTSTAHAVEASPSARARVAPSSLEAVTKPSGRPAPPAVVVATQKSRQDGARSLKIALGAAVAVAAVAIGALVWLLASS